MPSSQTWLPDELPLTGMTEAPAAAADAGNGADAREQVALHVVPSLHRHVEPAEVDARHEHALAPESRVDVTQVPEAAREEDARGDQHQRQRHLRGDERAPQPVALDTDDAAAGGPQREHRALARGAQARA